MKTKIRWFSILLAAGSLLAAGCGKSPEHPAAEAAPTSEPETLMPVFQSVSETDAILPIPELRVTAKPGDRVILEGKVMGTDQPFVDNRALFVVGDEQTITSCDLLEDDHCATPWDNCCDDPRVVRAGTATIQVVDDNGQVVKESIRGVRNLKELSRVRVRGTVAPQSSPEALIINAEGIDVL